MASFAKSLSSLPCAVPRSRVRRCCWGEGRRLGEAHMFSPQFSKCSQKRVTATAALAAALPPTGDALFEGPGLPPSTVDHEFELLASSGLPGSPTTILELRGEFNAWSVGELRCASGCAGRHHLSCRSGRLQVWSCCTIPSKSDGH